MAENPVGGWLIAEQSAPRTWRVRARSRGRTALVLFIASLLAATAHAASVPDHGCRAPVRPPDDVPEVVWQGFLEAVDSYRACISNYVTRNNALADAHRTAANEATLAWNAFVRDSLNVPEDFPWPPEGER